MRKIDLFSPFVLLPVSSVTLFLAFSDELSEESIFKIILFYAFYMAGVLVISLLYPSPDGPPVYDRKSISNFLEGRRFLNLLSSTISVTYVLILVVLIAKGLGSGLDPSTFRFTFKDSIGGAKVTFVTTLFLYLRVFFISLRSISQKKKTYHVETILYLLVLFFVGSRTYLFTIGLVVLMTYYAFGSLSNRSIFMFGVFGVSSLIGVRLYTYLSLDAATLKFFLENDLIIPDDPLKTVFNLSTLTFRNMVSRTNDILQFVPHKLQHFQGRSFFFQFYALFTEGTQSDPHILLNRSLFKGSENDVGYPPTIFSQFYLDFGLVGQIVGAFLVGLLYNSIYLMYRREIKIQDIFRFVYFTYGIVISIYGAFPAFNMIGMFCLMWLLDKQIVIRKNEKSTNYK